MGRIVDFFGLVTQVCRGIYLRGLLGSHVCDIKDIRYHSDRLVSDHPICHAKVVAYETILGENFVPLAYGNCRDLPNVLNVLLMPKVNFEKKILCLPLRNIGLLYCRVLRYCYNNLLSSFGSIICQVVAYGRLKTKEIFKLLALKVDAVAYEKWSLTSGSKDSDLSVFWKTGR